MSAAARGYDEVRCEWCVVGVAYDVGMDVRCEKDGDRDIEMESEDVDNGMRGSTVRRKCDVEKRWRYERRDRVEEERTDDAELDKGIVAMGEGGRETTKA